MKICTAAALAIVTVTSAARADTTKKDAAAATALFYEARNLMAKGRYAEACPKLEESQRLDAGIGTQFNLADCNEHVGKLATAWAGFVEVAAAARASGQAAREKIARQRADALAPRLPRLVVETTSPPPGLEVRRDGTVVAAASFGSAIPVDPGSHTVHASAPGKQPWETTVQATEGATARATVPALADAAVAVPSTPPAAPPEPAGAPVETTSATTDIPPGFPEPVEDHDGSTQRTIGIVIGAAGIAGLAIGGGFGLRSISKRDDARTHCQGDLCDAQGVALRDDAIRAGNVATGAAIAGGIALAGGILLVVTAPRGKPSVGMGVGPGTVRVGGTF